MARRPGGGAPGAAPSDGAPGSDPVLEPPPPEEEKRPVVYRAGKLPKELPPWFAQMDEDKDGQVGLYEWKKAGRPVSEFQAMDLNGDGFITVEEALRYVKIQAKNVASNAPSNGFGGAQALVGSRVLAALLAEVHRDLAASLAEVHRDLAASLAEVHRDLAALLAEVHQALAARRGAVRLTASRDQGTIPAVGDASRSSSKRPP